MFHFKDLQRFSRDDFTGDILRDAQNLQVAPVMIIRRLLQLEGFTKREIKEIIAENYPPPAYLKDALEVALNNDPIFSPKGIQYSKKRGRIGEDLIAEWLDTQSIEYTRDLGQGGPDLLLKTPIKLDIHGRVKEFNWIESKASYGDSFEIKRNRAQFCKYEPLGQGLIFYWYGVEVQNEWNVFIWKDLYRLVDRPLKMRIRKFIAFVPPEFKHLLNHNAFFNK